MVRPTNQETIAIRKVVHYSHLPRGGGTPHHITPHKATKSSTRLVRRQREHGEMCAIAFIVVSKGRDDKAGLTGLGLTSLNDFSRLRAQVLSLVA